MATQIPDRPRRQRTIYADPYLVAHFAKSQLWHASTLLFGFFLTEACGLSVEMMGRIMAGSLALNGIVDAVLGWRWRGRVVHSADAIRLQAWGAPLTCLFFVLFCSTPQVETGQRLAWALTMLLGFRVSYPFIDMPQNALVALAPLTSEARCTLLAKRNIASGLAGLAVGALAAPLLVNSRDVIVWLIWASCLATFACGTAWWLGKVRVIAGGCLSSMTVARSPLPFAVLLGTLAVMMMASAIFRTLEPYHAAFAGRGTGLMFWAAIGGLASQFVSLTGGRKVATPGRLILAVFLPGVAAIGLLWATPVGTALAGLGFGMATGGLWLALWSVMMNHAAAGQATGYVGTFTCVSKLAQAIAMLLLGQVMATSSYRDTFADPRSTPSLLMLASLLAIAATAIGLAFACRLSRTAYDGRPARPLPVGRQDPDPRQQHPA